VNDRVHTCRCGTEFVYRKHETNPTLAPIETEPSENGNVAVLDNGRYRIVTKASPYDGVRYRSHFASCPYSARFRKA
jgi:hypothetical protein